MGLLDRLFGRGNAGDPTTAWAAAAGPSPQVNFDRKTLGTSFAQLPFGGDISEGAFLGRADTFSGNAQHFTLAYHRWRLEVSFEARQLAEVGFQIGQDAPPRAGVVPATPTGPDGLALTASTTEADLLSRFGEPGSRQDFEDETILYYNVGPLVSEFLLDEEKRLLSWTVYLD